MSSSCTEVGCGGTAEKPATFSELFGDYANYSRRVRDLSAETIKSYGRYQERFVAAQPERSPEELFGSLTPARIQQYLVEYAKNHGSGSQRWMQYSLRALLRYCYHKGYLPSDLSGAVPVFRRRRLSSVPRAIDDDTIRLLLESIDPGSPVGLRDLAIIRLLATYGIRAIQVWRLRLDDIDWTGDRIRFVAAKGGKAIVQQLTPEVGNSLLAYVREARPNTTPYSEVFLTSRAPIRPFKTSKSVSSIITWRLNQIDARLPEGVSRGTHSFRHAFAVRMVGRVLAGTKHIADMLGHRDLSSTFLYSKVDFTALAETALPWPKEVAQ